MADIPHLDRFGQLCTFDDTGAFPDPDQPGEAVCAVIERAVQLLRDGVAGTNVGDYADEFEAYWRDGAARPLGAISDVAALGPHRRIVVLPLASALGLYTRLFAETDAAAIAFAEAIGRASEKPEPESALYLHLDGIAGAPNITTNADVYKLVGQTTGAREALLAFLRDVPRPSRVLFSVPIANDRVFGAWVHPRYGTDINRGKHSRRVMDQVRGFRPGHLTPQVELTSVCAGLVVDRVVVRRADAARLALRTTGAAAEIATDSSSVNIVGCGSLGGFIADTVRQIVPARLRLADPEDMEVHNVPRHLCDLTTVGTNKAHERVLTWIGDIDRARREGWELTDAWAGAAAFTLHDVRSYREPIARRVVGDEDLHS